jgi:hypothetical protein
MLSQLCHLISSFKHHPLLLSLITGVAPPPSQHAMSLDVAHFTPINRVEPVPSSSTAPHQPRCLPDIPVDVLRLIAENLDRASAFALTLTCKSLRDAGEIKVWETLDLTTGYDRECHQLA